MSLRLPAGIAGARRTSNGWEASISLIVDDEGGFGRRCPLRDCRSYFKLYQDEYGLARSRRRLTCPACGHTGGDESFWTPEQVAYLRNAGKQLARAAAHEALASFSRSLGGQKVRLGPNVSIQYTAHHNPPPVPEPLPSYVEQATLRTFTCPAGGHRAVIYDLLSACPYCGPDTPRRAIFDDNLAAMSRRLQDAEGMSPEQVAAGEQTTAIEQSLTRVVSALQDLAKQLHARRADAPAPGNPWQNLERLRRRWVADFDRDPADGLEATTLTTLRLAFERRHVIEHNGSVIDQRYVNETGEGALGRRLRLTPAFVRQAHDAAVKLADNLEATLPLAGTD